MRASPKRASTKTALDLPKARARHQDVPSKVLLVDDDELELSLMADRLMAAGFQVTIANNGEEALKILERDWFPLILTDWQMPVMDGIQFIEKLRERGGDDSYCIMLSVRAASEDFERGYCAGVDDYLSKKSSDTEIMARIESGLSTVALRRSLRQSRAALAISQANNEATFDDAKAHLTARLQAEISRSRRYKRSCSALVLGIHPSLTAPNVDRSSDAPRIEDSARVALMQALQGVIRIDVDTVVLYDSGERHVQFAIVLPETGPAEVAVIRSRARAALLQTIRNQVAMADAYDVSIGAASIDPSSERVDLTAAELLAAAENCRRCMASCGARRLAAVQSSVVSQVAIPCRHGYAVADHCLELNHRYADENKARPEYDVDQDQAGVAIVSLQASSGSAA